ncbi:MAG: Grx4 family monothiol glutaredoxin [Myxococcales bacterium]|nr:Grx4 family monothiol glutaredoxin [Myxococcales bacterium]
MDSSVRDRIHGMVSQYPIMLFMKGTPQAPQCGFSARVANILQDLGVRYASFDVLADPEVRQGIKDYGNWPTIPQLYVDGELVGGSDILSEMFVNGELQTLLDEPSKKMQQLAGG